MSESSFVAARAGITSADPGAGPATERHERALRIMRHFVRLWIEDREAKILPTIESLTEAEAMIGRVLMGDEPYKIVEHGDQIPKASA